VKLAPYSSYRTYDDEWLPQLPNHWHRRRLKFLASYVTSGGTPTTGNDAFWGGDIPWVSPKDMKVACIEETEDCLTQDGLRSSASTLVPEGTLLIVVRSGILRHSIPVALAGREVAINQDIKAVVFGDGVESGYVRYFIEGIQNSLLPRWSKLGCTVESIEHEYMINEELPAPPLDEQRAIVRFLDTKTAEIDTLIAKKERLLELLAERDRSAISHAIAVLKGKATRLRYHVDLLPGYAFPSDAFSRDPGDVRLLRGINVSTDGIRWDDTVYWPQEDCSQYEAFQLADGDVVFGMDRPWIGRGVRVARLSASDLPCLLLQRVALLRPGRLLLSSYLELILRSNEFHAHFEPDLTGISVPHISGEQMLSYSFLLPSIEAQHVAVRVAQRRLRRSAVIRAKIERALEALSEYRSALITAAATGQVDVRGWEHRKAAA
jgi:type I restriction enzyme S subunit